MVLTFTMPPKATKKRTQKASKASTTPKRPRKAPRGLMTATQIAHAVSRFILTAGHAAAPPVRSVPYVHVVENVLRDAVGCDAEYISEYLVGAAGIASQDTTQDVTQPPDLEAPGTRGGSSRYAAERRRRASSALRQGLEPKKKKDLAHTLT